MMRSIKLKEAIEGLENSIKIYGNENLVIDGLNLCNSKTEYNSILTYATNSKYTDIIKENKNIKAIVVNSETFDIYKKILGTDDYSFLVTDRPEEVFYYIHELLIQKNFYDNYFEDKKIGENCKIHKSCIIENGVIIGDNVNIGANTVICKGTVIENNVSIGCNNTIGNDGFQMIKFDGYYKNISHMGGVLIKQNAYVADNCNIARSIFEGKTYIGENVHIDSLNQIAHNTYIGDNTVITPSCTILGSVKICNNAWIGAGTCILNRVIIGDNALIGIGSVVTRNISSFSKAYGNPAKEHK